MKTIKTVIAAIFIMFALTSSSHAQWFWWQGEPTPLTDSLSDNINPHLFYNGTSFYMAWEKPVDSLTTAIWFRDITAQTPDIELLSVPNVHYKNPKMLGLWYSADFYLFYETDEAGNDDIYYMYNEGLGTFSDPIPFADTEFDENSFYPDHAVYYGREDLGMAWIKNNSLYYSTLSNNQFSDPVMIDSGNCHNPVISDYGGDIIWEKGDSIEKYIAFSKNWSGNWTAPDTVFYSSHCMNLKADKINRSSIIFSFQVDSVWKIGAGERNGYNYDVDTLDITKDAPFMPAITTYWIPVGNPDFWQECFISFPYPDSISEEIYMNLEPWWLSQYFNFSQLETVNRNPDFFCSPFPYDPDCEGIYLVWESFQNGHWQLYYSLEMQQCYGAIDENDLANSFIKSHPNPFTHETTIEFTLDSQSDVAIEIYNSRGIQIHTIASRTYDQGTHQFRWNADGLPAGMYVVKMRVGDRIYTSKLLKN